MTIDLSQIEEEVAELGEFRADPQYLVFQSIADVATAEEFAAMDHPLESYERENCVGMLIISAILYSHYHGIDLDEAVSEAIREIESYQDEMDTFGVRQ